MCFQVLCNLNYLVVESFQDIFFKFYITAHVSLTTKLINVTKLYAFLLHTNSISWSILSSIRLTENDTTYYSREFIRVFLYELIRLKGFDGLCTLLHDPLVKLLVNYNIYIVFIINLSSFLVSAILKRLSKDFSTQMIQLRLNLFWIILYLLV